MHLSFDTQGIFFILYCLFVEDFEAKLNEILRATVSPNSQRKEAC